MGFRARIQRDWRANDDHSMHRRPHDSDVFTAKFRQNSRLGQRSTCRSLQDASGFRDGEAALFAMMMSVGDAAVAELRGLRADVRELIAILRTHRAPAMAEHAGSLSEKLPAMMTIAEAAEMLRTSKIAVSADSARRYAGYAGVVRVGPEAADGEDGRVPSRVAQNADIRLNTGDHQRGASTT